MSSQNRKRSKTGRRRKRLSRPRQPLRSFPHLTHYIWKMLSQTVLSQILVVFALLWLLAAGAIYWSERDVSGSTIQGFGDALYWTVAAFSTAGIADMPQSDMGKLVGGAWIIIGSIIFFGTIVAAVTSYFMRPLQRPANQIVETIEYNLERMDDLTVEELELLKQTSDALLGHMEKLKEAEASRSR